MASRTVALVASICVFVSLLVSPSLVAPARAQSGAAGQEHRLAAQAALDRGDVNEALKQSQLNLVEAEQSGSVDRLWAGQLDLAAIYTLRWEFQDAAAAVESARAAGAPKDPDSQFRDDSIEAEYEAATSDFPAAAMHLADAIKLAQTSLSLGDDHPKTAALYSLLGLVELASEQLDKSRDDLTRAAGILDETYGPEYIDSAIARDRFARALLQTGHFDDALAQATRAVEAARKLGPPARIELSDALLTRGLIDLAAYKFTSAEESLQESLLQTRAVFGGGLRTVPRLTALAEVALEQGDAARARTLINQALEIYNPNPAPDWIPGAELMRAAAEAASREGRSKDAADLLERALQIASARLGAGSLLAARVVETRGNLALDAGDLDRAAADYSQALATRQKTLPAGHPDLASSAIDLAILSARRGFPSVSVEAMYKDAINSVASTAGPDSLSLVPALERYALFLRSQKRDQDAAELDKRIQQIVSRPR